MSDNSNLLQEVQFLIQLKFLIRLLSDEAIEKALISSKVTDEAILNLLEDEYDRRHSGKPCQSCRV